MGHLIDADDLKARVEREKEKQMDIWRNSTSEDALGMALDKISVYNQILSFIEEQVTTTHLH